MTAIWLAISEAVASKTDAFVLIYQSWVNVSTSALGSEFASWKADASIVEADIVSPTDCGILVD